jgi:alpha/beta superfamily hydrolase
MSVEPREFFLNGPAGVLQGLWYSSGHPDDFLKATVVCHPHPQLGGTMENEIVRRCCRYISETGIEAVTFNFRGVHKSEGTYDAGPGERADTLAVLDHLLKVSPKARVAVVGYSFGAWVGLDAGNSCASVDVLAAIAPVARADYSFLQPSSKRKLIVWGEHDEYTNEQARQEFLQRLSPPVETTIVPGVGHLFGGRVDDLAMKVADFVSGHL